MVVKSIGKEMYTGKFNGPDSIKVSIYTKNKPIAPPSIQSTAASIKNSKRILLLLAPIAFFNPIILVLSLTVTNIMLAIPNIPTIKLMPPIIEPTKFIIINDSEMALLNASTLFNEKLSSCVGLNLLIWRMMPFNSSINAAGITPSFPLAIKMGLVNFSSKSCLQNW